MDIRFEHRNKFIVYGYSVETELSSCDTDIGQLSEKYEDTLLNIPEGKSCLYGVMWYTEGHKYYYLMGIEGSDKTILDDGSTHIDIPSAYFAVATVPHNLTIIEAWTDYFEKELPALGYIPDAEHGIYFEFHNSDGICELWTPVKTAN